MYEYEAIVRDWHDGDTCHADLDLGFGFILTAYDLDARPRISVRIQTGSGQAINAPELNTDAGKAALAYAKQLCPAGTKVTVKSHLWDKYGGRIDGALELPNGTDFGQAMVDAGQAVIANY